MSYEKLDETRLRIIGCEVACINRFLAGLAPIGARKMCVLREPIRTYQFCPESRPKRRPEISNLFVSSTSRVLKNSQTPRRLVLMKAGTTPSLVQPIHIPTCSGLFSTRATLSPCFQPSRSIQLATPLLYSKYLNVQLWSLYYTNVSRTTNVLKVFPVAAFQLLNPPYN